MTRRVMIYGLVLLPGALIAADPGFAQRTDSPGETIAGEGVPVEERGKSTKPLDPNKLSKSELRAALAVGRMKKQIEQQLRRLELTNKSGRDKPTIDDHFVIARFHTTVKTGQVEVRFGTSAGTEGTAEELAKYISSAPRGTTRIYKIVSRVKTADEAQQRLKQVRSDYDDARLFYQNQLLRFVQGQMAVRAASMKRC